MPRVRQPKSKKTTSVEPQKAEIVPKNDKHEESDEEMPEATAAVDEIKSKRTISKSSAVPKTKKMKKSDDEEEEINLAANGKGAKGKTTPEPEPSVEKTKIQNAKSTKSKDKPEPEVEAPTEKVIKNQNGKSTKKAPTPEVEPEEKVAKPAAKGSKTETMKDKTAPKRGGRGRNTKQPEKNAVDEVSDAEKEVEVEKVSEKPLPTKGKAKNAKQVEKIVADDDDETESGADKQDAATDSNVAEVVDADSFENNSKTKDGRKWNFKISTWNVCGLRAWIKKGGFNFFKEESPDVIVLQETKVQESDLTDEMRNVDGYSSHFVKVTGKGGKKGYAGVALYSKTKPISVTFGMNVEEHDIDGRLITAEYEKFYLVGAYVPNAGSKLVRLDARRAYNKDFLAYIKALDAKKPVVYCGDLNVAHNPIDLARPDSNHKSAGFSDAEREDFTALLKSGFVDTFRSLYPKKTGAYTFWTNIGGCRAKNVGWRLDYFVVSERFEKNVCDNVIRSKVMGSDHCPSTLFLAL